MAESEPTIDLSSETSPPWIEKLSVVKKDIKSELLSLTANDNDLRDTGRNIFIVLAMSEDFISKLKKAYPNDPDIYLFEQMYADLNEDLNRHEETDLDSSFETILTEMGSVIEKSGVRRENPKDSILMDTVLQLKAVGVEAEYVVTKGDPNAPTIVLFKQIHGLPTTTREQEDDIGITGSQHMIRDAIIAATNAGIISTVYPEIMPEDPDMARRASTVLTSGEVDNVFSRAGVMQAKKSLGDNVNLVGYDEDTLKMNPRMMFQNRDTVHNVFMASNLEQLVSKSDQQLSFLTIGAGHETHFDEGHPLPLSSTLAYYGMNVIVVDAFTSYYNAEAKERHMPT